MSARRWRSLIAASAWIALIAAYAWVGARSDLGALELLRRFVAFLSTHPAGPAIFVAAYALRPLLLFSAGLLSVAAGILFGPVWGVVYTVIGSNLGAALAYGMGRYFGGDLVPSRSGAPDHAANEEGGRSRWRRYLDELRDRTFTTVLLLRTIYAPYDLVNLLSGFVRAPFWPFLLATALGSLPGTISFTLLGASTGLDAWPPSFDPWLFAVSVVIFGASLALARRLRRNDASPGEDAPSPRSPSTGGSS